MTLPITPRATVLIPAHNEAAVIARTLAPLRALAQDGTIALIVVANACSDETALIAALACPKARVVITPIGGKTHALNLGLTAARQDLPLICLDADLTLSPDGLLALIDAIEAGALAAIGQMRVDSAAASPLVRAYQRAWSHNPYFAGFMPLRRRLWPACSPCHRCWAMMNFCAAALRRSVWPLCPPAPLPPSRRAALPACLPRANAPCAGRGNWPIWACLPLNPIPWRAWRAPA